MYQVLMAVSAAHQHMGEDAAAIAAAERGLAIARKTGEPEDGEAWALVMIGQIALEANDLATAKAKLEEALPLAKDTPERPGGRVEAGYYLARALWDFDPTRRLEAHDLVTRARERYAELEDTEWVEKMDAWLAEHPRPVGTP